MSRTWHHAPWRVRSAHPVGHRRGLPHGLSPCYPWVHETAPTLDAHLFWWGPARAQMRDVLRAAVADWNTNGATDLEPEPRQHRHAMWGGGWWD